MKTKKPDLRNGDTTISFVAHYSLRFARANARNFRAARALGCSKSARRCKSFFKKDARRRVRRTAWKLYG
jgi:hypothetical protein